MIKVNYFPYNDFQINTYILTYENNDCIIIDPGCFYPEEKKHFMEFIKKNELNPVLLVNTHGHIDHVAGNQFIKDNFDIKIAAHKEDELLIMQAEQQGMVFGFNVQQPPEIDLFLAEGDSIDLNNEKLEILHLPGHSPGSIGLLCESDHFIISGDVLFKNGIGRTDLPGGDYEILIHSIREKLFLLHDNTKVFSGHGPETTIGHEKKTNPFLN